MTRSSIPAYLALVAILVGFVNFFWLFVESASAGDAAQGYVENGHYFLGNKGTFTEVSEAAFRWSQIHVASLLISHPLALAGMAFLLFRYVFPAMTATRALPAQILRERADSVRASGRVIASGRVGGGIGAVRFSGPLIAVSVFPGGVVLKPLAMAERAILASELREVIEKRGAIGTRVEVFHAGVDADSPFVIYGFRTDLVAAIRGVIGTVDDGRSRAELKPVDEEFAARRRRPARYGLPPGIWFALNIAGLAVGLVLVGIGLTWAIPRLGMPGVVWTVIAVAITGYNFWRFILDR